MQAYNDNAPSPRLNEAKFVLCVIVDFPRTDTMPAVFLLSEIVVRTEETLLFVGYEYHVDCMRRTNPNRSPFTILLGTVD